VIQPTRFLRLCRWSISLVIASFPIGAVANPPMADIVRGSQAGFRQPAQADVVYAKDQLTRSANRLEEFLNRRGAKGDAWSKYLGLRMLRELLLSDAQGEDDIEYLLEDLSSVLLRFTAHHDGLDRKPFESVRDDLQIYIQSIEDLTIEDLRDQFGKRLDRLAAALEEYGKSPTGSLYNDIDEHLRWLVQRRQTPHLVQRLREQFAHPNFLLSVRQKAVSGGVYTVSQRKPVRDCILGTSIYGHADIRGRVTVSYVPSDTFGAFRLNLTAHGVTRDSVGYNGPVRLRSDSYTDMAAHKVIYVSETGITTVPAAAGASTSSSTKALATVFPAGGLLDRIVRRSAWRRAHQQKRQVELIASDHAARDLRKDFDQNVAKEVRDANAQYISEVRGPLTRLGQFPRLAFRTTSHQFQISGWQASPKQLMAARPAPALGDSDVGLQLHQSAVNNLADRVFAGRTFSSRDIRELENTHNQNNGEEFIKDEEEVRIIFADHRPVIVEMDDDIFNLTLRGKEFFSKGKVYSIAMDIVVRYRVEPHRTGFELVMVDAPSVETTSGRLALGSAALRRTLRNVLERDLKKTIDLSKVTLPDGLRDQAELLVQQLSFEEGWLLLNLDVVAKRDSQFSAFGSTRHYEGS
jgi:hypothetical protein